MDERESTIELIKITIDKIRPFLMRDGGDLQFVDFIDGIVYVRMLGACDGCTLASADIAEGIAIIIMEEVPGVIAVKSYEEMPQQK